jgi:hypothetical protein
MAVANGEHARGVATPRIIRFKRLVNVPLSKIEPTLLDLNRSICQLRPRPEQTSQIRGRNAEFVCRLADIDAMPAEGLDHHVEVETRDALGNDGLAIGGRKHPWFLR